LLLELATGAVSNQKHVPLGLDCGLLLLEGLHQDVGHVHSPSGHYAGQLCKRGFCSCEDTEIWNLGQIQRTFILQLVGRYV
jgi:hypothetical protein